MATGRMRRQDYDQNDGSDGKKGKKSMSHDQTR